VLPHKADAILLLLYKAGANLIVYHYSVRRTYQDPNGRR